jgi:hypothetical protein
MQSTMEFLDRRIAAEPRATERRLARRRITFLWTGEKWRGGGGGGGGEQLFYGRGRSGEEAVVEVAESMAERWGERTCGRECAAMLTGLAGALPLPPLGIGRRKNGPIQHNFGS